MTENHLSQNKIQQNIFQGMYSFQYYNVVIAWLQNKRNIIFNARQLICICEIIFTLSHNIQKGQVIWSAIYYDFTIKGVKVYNIIKYNANIKLKLRLNEETTENKRQ